jgi:hypothetical protein
MSLCQAPPPSAQDSSAKKRFYVKSQAEDNFLALLCSAPSLSVLLVLSGRSRRFGAADANDIHGRGRSPAFSMSLDRSSYENNFRLD